uniref:Uncharacterized protein n=1 Tax=Lates calcarifer TaxID=8187 RepID=A0A4W6CRF0_LATCA
MTTPVCSLSPSCAYYGKSGLLFMSSFLFPPSISESFLTVKGAALFLPRGNSPTPNSAPRISQRRNKHTGDLQKHLQTMFTVLRPEDTIRLVSNTHKHTHTYRCSTKDRVQSGIVIREILCQTEGLVSVLC